MKKYERPLIDIVEFDNLDVIVMSGEVQTNEESPAENDVLVGQPTVDTIQGSEPNTSAGADAPSFEEPGELPADTPLADSESADVPGEPSADTPPADSEPMDAPEEPAAPPLVDSNPIPETSDVPETPVEPSEPLDTVTNEEPIV